jgi:CRP-like cAMP-binding protein/predicted MFS family arabinose efflux permease
MAVVGRSFRDALSNRDVRVAVLGQAAGTSTQYLVTTALAIHLVSVLGPGSLWMLSLRYLPAALLGPLSAAPTDRLGPRNALILIFGGRAVTLGAAALTLAAGVSVGVLVALTVVEAALGTACLPALAAAQVSAARSPQELSAASALQSSAKSLAEVLGALAAGFLSALMSPAAVFAVIAGVAITGSLGALGLRASSTRARPLRRLEVRGTFFADWGMVRDRKIAVTTGLAAVRASNRAVWVGLSVIAATGFLKMGTAGVGELAAAAGVGAVVAIPVGARLIGRHRSSGTLALAIAGMGLPLVLIGVTGSALAALLLIPIWGLCGATAEIHIGCLIPRVAARRVANAVSLNETFRNWAQAGATLLLPLSVTAFGARSAVAVWGGIQIAAAAISKRRIDQVDVEVASHIRILELIHSIEMFRPLRVVELEQVAASVSPREIRAGEVVIRELDRGAESMFIIESGTVEVTRRGERLRELAAGDSFGQIALLHRAPRTASVTAISDGTLLELDRAGFIGAVSDYKAGPAALELAATPAGMPVTLAHALRSLPMLSALDSTSRAALANAAVVRTVEPGEVLCAEGDVADRLFVMLDGTADVLFGEQIINDIVPGRWFGEFGLLHQVGRTATVVAREAGTIAELPVQALTAAIGHAPTAADLARPPD